MRIKRIRGKIHDEKKNYVKKFTKKIEKLFFQIIILLSHCHDHSIHHSTFHLHPIESVYQPKRRSCASNETLIFGFWTFGALEEIWQRCAVWCGRCRDEIHKTKRIRVIIKINDSSYTYTHIPRVESIEE